MLCWLRLLLIETHIISVWKEGLSSPEPCLLLGNDSEDVDGEEEESSFVIDVAPGRKEALDIGLTT